MTEPKTTNVITVEKAAIMTRSGVVWSVDKPKRHRHVFDLICKKPWRASRLDVIQGFILSDGRFVDRKEAAEIAYRAGQIENLCRELYTESLW